MGKDSIDKAIPATTGSKKQLFIIIFENILQ